MRGGPRLRETPSARHRWGEIVTGVFLAVILAVLTAAIGAGAAQAYDSASPPWVGSICGGGHIATYVYDGSPNSASVRVDQDVTADLGLRRLIAVRVGGSKTFSGCRGVCEGVVWAIRCPNIGS